MCTGRGPLVAALLGAILLSGCDLTSVEQIESEDVVVVEAYLRTDASIQEAFLYRTLPGQEGSLRVDGAVVELIRESDGARLPLAAADSGCADYSVFPAGQAGTCYRSGDSPGFVLPGDTYDLTVDAPGDRRLEGQTTVPGSFDLLAPSASPCRIPGGGDLELVWSRAEGAWSYQAVAAFDGLEPGLQALGVVDPPNELELLGLAIGAADTTLVFPQEFGVFDRFTLDRDVALALQQGLPDGASAAIVLAAADRNFVNWVRGGNFNPSGQVRVPSVVGDGTGVLASFTAVRQSFFSATGSYPDCQ